MHAANARPTLRVKGQAWVEVDLTTGKGTRSFVKIHPFGDKSVWVPHCRGVALTGTFVVKKWPFMVPTCVTVHRVRMWVSTKLPFGFRVEGSSGTQLYLGGIRLGVCS